jgi:hypothetical protein
MERTVTREPGANLWRERRRELRLKGKGYKMSVSRSRSARQPVPIDSQKPKMPKPATPAPEPVKPSDGPVFEATWSDGTQTRMSIYAWLDNLNVNRAAAVSRAAYSSRHRVPMPEIVATITEAHFEKDGAIIASCTADDLKKRAVPVGVCTTSSLGRSNTS